MAPPGTATPMTGFQVTAVLPSTLVALTMACGLADRSICGLKPKVAGPGGVVRGGMGWRGLPAGMVSAGLPAPVVKSLEDTEAAQSAPKPRPSVTPTVPRGGEMVVPGAPEPRDARAGGA